MRKLLKTCLCRRYFIKGINTWAVSLVRYSVLSLEWTKEEVRQMDQRTKKLMMMHMVLHPRNDLDYIFQEKKEEEYLPTENKYEDSKTILKRAKKD